MGLSASAVAGCISTARKKRILVLLCISCTVIVIVLSVADDRIVREEMLEQEIANLRAEIDYLKSMYRMRQEDVLRLKESRKKLKQHDNTTVLNMKFGDMRDTMMATTDKELYRLVKNISGSHAATGMLPKTFLGTTIIYQLLPHLLDDPKSCRAGFHMKGPKRHYNMVIGIPTVRRDKESYLMVTLRYLMDELKSADNSTVIIVYVGDTDLKYVLNVAIEIEKKFPKQVKSGIIEVISPSPGYYPNLDKETPTLGDSLQRFRWRTKQNLDAIFLMTYARTRGTHYLMLEDDVIAKTGSMKVHLPYCNIAVLMQLRRLHADGNQTARSRAVCVQFHCSRGNCIQTSILQLIQTDAASRHLKNPDWIMIDYSFIGGIGKLFKSADMLNFITYLQLFHRNMPIDWLLESFLSDQGCGIEKCSKTCETKKRKIRPKFKKSLFQHIGLYSSLRGKIQKIKNAKYGKSHEFYPHKNPPLRSAVTSIQEYNNYTLMGAYKGNNFFWGFKPKAGDFIQFNLIKPMIIESFLFRSGNVAHITDRLLQTVVEVLPAKESANVTVVGYFDEFGVAEGTIDSHIGPIRFIRLRMLAHHKHWVILSEIFLKPDDNAKIHSGKQTQTIDLLGFLV